jgi:hypothetical protein
MYQGGRLSAQCAGRHRGPADTFALIGSRCRGEVDRTFRRSDEFSIGGFCVRLPRSELGGTCILPAIAGTDRRIARAMPPLLFFTSRKID